MSKPPLSPRLSTEIGNTMQSPMNFTNDEQQALLSGEDLPRSQRSLLLEYRKLAQYKSLSTKQVERMNEIFEIAADDDVLMHRLELVDESEVSVLAGTPLLSKDKTQRAYISEHLGVLVREALMSEDNPGVSNSEDQAKASIFMLCPDGSGYTRIFFECEDVLNLEDFQRQLDALKQQICSKCNTTLAEHTSLINLGLGRTALTQDSRD